MYVPNSIRSERKLDLVRDSTEALWLEVRTKRSTSLYVTSIDHQMQSQHL